MSFAQKEQMLCKIFADALQGEMLLTRHLRSLVEKKVGKPVLEDFSGICSTGMAERRHTGPNIQRQHKSKKNEKPLKKAPDLLCAQGSEAKWLNVFFKDEARSLIAVWYENTFYPHEHQVFLLQKKVDCCQPF